MTFQSSAQLILQVGLFYLLISVGYLIARFSRRSGIIDTYLTGLLVKILIPVLTIYSILSISPETIIELPKILALTVLVHLLGPTVLYLRLRRRDIDNASKGSLYTCVAFNNALFIPLPLVTLFIGEEGIPLVIIFTIVQLFLFASLGSVIGSAFTEARATARQVARRTLYFPPLFAAMLAIALSLANFTLPETVASILSYSGPLSTYLSLVTVGLGVGTGSWTKDVRSVLDVIAIRQVIVPLLTLPIIVLSGLPAVASQVILIEAMMPPAVLTVVFAGWFGLNSQKAATLVTVGTLILLPELPLILLLTR